jgi:TatD family-associated radical SAM protein
MKRAMPMPSKKPSVVYWLEDNLYLNITNRCSNNCYFCFRRYKNGINGFNLKLLEEPTLSEITDELQTLVNRKPWKEIVFCGFGEPLEKLDHVLEVTKWIKKHFPITVRIDTNGQAYLSNKGKNVIEELKEAGVDKISVSLNAHNKETYNYVCKPKFQNAYESVIEFIKKARERFDTEITAVNIPEVDFSKVKETAEEMGVKFRLREYHPCFW